MGEHPPGGGLITQVAVPVGVGVGVQQSDVGTRRGVQRAVRVAVRDGVTVVANAGAIPSAPITMDKAT